MPIPRAGAAARRSGSAWDQRLGAGERARGQKKPASTASKTAAIAPILTPGSFIKAFVFKQRDAAAEFADQLEALIAHAAGGDHFLEIADNKRLIRLPHDDHRSNSVLGEKEFGLCVGVAGGKILVGHIADDAARGQ